MKCLGLHFKDELEYLLQAVKAVNDNLAQSLQESQEARSFSSRDEDVSLSNEEQLHMSNWRELLDTRPRLYARLIETLDTVISWGGPLPKTDIGDSFNECQVPPGSCLTRQYRADKASLKLTPAHSHRSIEQRLRPMSYGDGPVGQLEAGATDSGFLHLEGLHESFSDIDTHKLDLSQFCLSETPGETYSPTSLDPSRRTSGEEIVDGGRRVLDQVAPPEGINPTAIDFIDVDDMILGDALSDDWVDALLEKEISLQGDSAGQSAEDVDMDAAMTV
jgi:hypothetical protein